MNDSIKLLHELNVAVGKLFAGANELELSNTIESVLVNYNVEKTKKDDSYNDFLEHVDMYISSRRIEGLSEITLKCYIGELKLFNNYLNKSVSKVTTPDIRNYLASQTNVQKSTLGTKLNVIKSFFSWMYNEDIIERDVASKIKPIKLPKRLPKGLSIEELEIVRESCETLREIGLVNVLYSTAARLSEICNMNISDVDFHNMSIKVIGKGNIERNVFLSERAMYHLKKYLESRNDDCEALFVTQRKPYRRVLQRALQREVKAIQARSGIETNLHPHLFRRSHSILSIRSGMKVEDLQAILGHASPSTTISSYANVSEERKHNAFIKHHVQ